jgi:hypothetical protein
MTFRFQCESCREEEVRKVTRVCTWNFFFCEKCLDNPESAASKVLRVLRERLAAAREAEREAAKQKANQRKKKPRCPANRSFHYDGWDVPANSIAGLPRDVAETVEALFRAQEIESLMRLK